MSHKISFTVKLLVPPNSQEISSAVEQAHVRAISLQLSVAFIGTVAGQVRFTVFQNGCQDEKADRPLNSGAS